MKTLGNLEKCLIQDKKTLTEFLQEELGIYAQDLIAITDKFKVLAGLRWSYFRKQKHHCRKLFKQH